MFFFGTTFLAAGESTNTLIGALDDLNLNDFEKALNEGVSANDLHDGVPVLLLVVATNQSQFVRALFEHSKSRVDPNVVLPNGSTALHLAAAAGNSDIIEVLIKYGANPTLKNAHGVTADQIASTNHLDGTAKGLEQRAERRTRQFYSVLRKYGYFEYSNVSDVDAQRRALSLFDQENSAHISPRAFERAENLRSLQYAYVYSFLKNGEYQFASGSGDFSGVIEAFETAKQGCAKQGGTECSIHVAPQGTCIALSKPKQPKQYVISRISATIDAAIRDARNRCIARALQCDEPSHFCAKAN